MNAQDYQQAYNYFAKERDTLDELMFCMTNVRAIKKCITDRDFCEKQMAYAKKRLNA